jgi:CheY-like chemotaxis protein
MHFAGSIPQEVFEMKSIALGGTTAAPANDQTATLRILVAEDNDTMRRLLSFVLRSDGHEVIEARTGTELLEALACALTPAGRLDFDAILSEQTLPGLNGLTVLAGVRARGHTTPFVLITADPDVQDQARRLSGVVLDQPFNTHAIRAAVASGAGR